MISSFFFFDPVVCCPCRTKDGINPVTNFLGHYKFLDWVQRWVKLLQFCTQPKNALIPETRWMLLYHHNQFFFLQWLLLIWCVQRCKYATKVHLVVWIYWPQLQHAPNILWSFNCNVCQYPIFNVEQNSQSSFILINIINITRG